MSVSAWPATLSFLQLKHHSEALKTKTGCWDGRCAELGGGTVPGRPRHRGLGQLHQVQQGAPGEATGTAPVQPLLMSFLGPLLATALGAGLLTSVPRCAGWGCCADGEHPAGVTGGQALIAPSAPGHRQPAGGDRCGLDHLTPLQGRLPLAQAAGGGLGRNRALAGGLHSGGPRLGRVAGG